MNNDSRVFESSTNAQFRYDHVFVQVEGIYPVILRVHIAMVAWSAFHKIHQKSRCDIQVCLSTIDGPLNVTSDSDWRLVVEQHFQCSVELQVRNIVFHRDGSTEIAEFCVVAEGNLEEVLT